MSFKDFVVVLRPRQWYKNLLIFMPLIFSKSLLNFSLLPDFIIGFVLLCTVSSGSYVINDILDAAKDRINPEKRNRPIASGKIKKENAVILAVILFLAGISAAYFLSRAFFFYVALLFILSQLYSLVLKKEVYLDVVSISANFVVRSLSGYAFLPGIPVSPWLVLCVFFFAMFLSVGKRYSELLYLEEKSSAHRNVLSKYNENQLSSMLEISAVLFIIVMMIFPIFSVYSERILFISPLLVIMTFRFMELIKSGSVIGRHPEKAYADKFLLLSVLCYSLLTVLLIYI